MKSPSPSDLADKFMLRLPDGLRQVIAGSALKNDRSMNSEIVHILSAHFSAPNPTSADFSVIQEQLTLILERLPDTPKPKQST